jgi:hypothetical protein
VNNIPIPISNGILDPKHIHLICNPLGLFLWCIDRTTPDKKDPTVDGWVLGGMPIKYELLQEVFPISKYKLSKWLRKLKEWNYIHIKRTPYGHKLRVLKSKKFVFRSKENLKEKSRKLHLRSKENLTYKEDITVDITKTIAQTVPTRPRDTEPNYETERKKHVKVLLKNLTGATSSHDSL